MNDDQKRRVAQIVSRWKKSYKAPPHFLRLESITDIGLLQDYAEESKNVPLQFIQDQAQELITLLDEHTVTEMDLKRIRELMA